MFLFPARSQADELLPFGPGPTLQQNMTVMNKYSMTASRALRARCDACRGVTLVELLVVIVLSGLAVSALMLGLQSGLQALENRHSLRRCALLAEDIMSEVRSKAFADPETPAGAFGGLEEGDIRKDFDDVDDYDGFSNAPPMSIEGAPMAGYASMAISVSVENVLGASPDAPTPEPDGSTDFKRIRVTVSAGSTVVNLNSVVSRYDK